MEYVNDVQGVADLFRNHWLLIVALFAGYLLLAGLGSKVLAPLAGTVFGKALAAVQRAASAVFAAIVNRTPTPGPTPSADGGAEAALAAGQVLMGHAVRTGDSDLFNSATEVLGSLRNSAAAKLVASLLLLACVVGCGSGDASESVDYSQQFHFGALPPPSEEQLIESGSQPARTFRELYPHLVDSGTPAK